MTIDDQPAAEPAPSEAELLEQGVRSGANWFYWIAGLSMVNSAMQLFGSERSFIIGLGITQVFDAMASGATEGDAGVVARGFALVLDLAVAGLFVLFGSQAGRQKSWAFVAGMIVYALDGLLYLLVGGWLSLAFHVFALYCVWAGYSCLKKLRALEIQELGRPITP